MNYEALADRLIEANKHINLTAITEKSAIMTLHIEDSLTLCPYIPKGAAVIDVGTGGGFPALPLALARTDVRVTALDSTAKKLSFVRDTAKEFGLPLTTLCARAEDAVKDRRESYDAAVSRGVAALSALCELCLPFVKVGGVFIAMKAQRCEEELKAAEHAVAMLGGTFKQKVDCALSDGTVHSLIIINKTSPTPEIYPRRWKDIKASPI